MQKCLFYNVCSTHNFTNFDTKEKKLSQSDLKIVSMSAAFSWHMQKDADLRLTVNILSLCCLPFTLSQRKYNGILMLKRALANEPCRTV